MGNNTHIPDLKDIILKARQPKINLSQQELGQLSKGIIYCGKCGQRVLTDNKNTVYACEDCFTKGAGDKQNAVLRLSKGMILIDLISKESGIGTAKNVIF